MSWMQWAGIKKNCVLLGSLIMQLISYRERSSTPAAAMLFSKSTIWSVKNTMKKGYHSSQVNGCLMLRCRKNVSCKLIGQSVMLLAAHNQNCLDSILLAPVFLMRSAYLHSSLQLYSFSEEIPCICRFRDQMPSCYWETS